MKFRFPPASVAISWLCLLLQLNCGAVDEKTTAIESGQESGPATLEYALSWKTDDLIKNGNGEWEFTTKLGFPIRLSRGYLVTYSVQLVECPQEESMALKWFNRLLGIRTAYAGHPNPEDNPAGIYQSLGENIIEANSLTMGTVEVEPNSYCSLHYLVAGANQSTASLPTDINMLGTSIYLEGFYHSSEGNEWVPFTIHTALANGILNELYAELDNQEDREPFNLRVRGNHLLIQVQRQLSGFFEDVDFETMSARELEQEVLRGVVNNTQTAIIIQ